MSDEMRIDSEEQPKIEVSPEQLLAKRRKWARFTIGLALGVIVSLGGLAWGIRDWFVPGVSTSDTWTLPVSFIFFVEMAGLFAFSLQEFIKVGKRMK